MATNIGSVIVKIGADIDDLVKGVNKAESSLSKVGKTAVGIGKIIATSLLAAGAAISAMALKGIALGNELARTARIVGLTAAELGGLHHAAALSEVSTEQLDKGLQRLGRTVSEADSGLKSANRTLQELGLNADEMERLPLSEQFLKVTDAMKGMTSQGDKLRIATQLFGKSGAELIPLLDESSDSIRRMMEESKALGLQLDDTQSRVVQEASDALDRMKGSVTGLAMQFSANFGPAIKAAAEAITTITTSVTNALPTFSAWLARIVGIRRSLDDLSDAQAKAEINDNFKEMLENQERLKRMEASRGDFMFDSGRADLENRINQTLAEQADLRQRNMDLLDEIVQRAKDAKAAAEADDQKPKVDTSLLQEIEVSAQKIEVMRNFMDVAKEMNRARLDEEITVNSERMELMRQWSDSEILMAQQREGMLTQARKEGAEARVAFSKMESGQQIATTIGALTQITAAVAQHSKKAFELNKLAAVANAIVNTAQGATKALAQGGFAGIAMAAAVIAAGAVQIAAIKKTQFQGGGTGTTPSAVGTTAVVNSQPVPAAASAGQSSVIRVEGLSGTSMFSSKAVRELLERLQDAQRDGGRLVIA